MIELVQLGDYHTDKLRKYWPNANALQANAYRGVIQRLLAQGLRHFVFCGDLAEGIKDATGNMLRMSEDGQVQLLRLLKEFDGRANMYVILGNHDVAETGMHSLRAFIEMQRLGMFKTVHFFEQPEIRTIEGVRINFLPWPHRKPTGPCDVAVAHYEVNGTISDSGRIITLQDENDHNYGVPFLQGHLHTTQRMGRHFYSGTLYQTSFGESLPKGYAMARVARGKFAWKHVVTPPPFVLENKRIDTSADLRTLVNDPLHLYKLYVASEVTVPDGMLEKFGNIVNRLDFSTEEELKELEQAEFVLDSKGIEVNTDDYLPNYFKSKGATDAQTRRAFEIIKELRSG